MEHLEGSMKERILLQFQNKKQKWKAFNMFQTEGIKDNIDAALVCEDWESTREPSMGNFMELMQPGALYSKLQGTREPSTEGQSQCDPGLEREV